MRYKKFVICFLFMFFLLPPVLYAHGVMGKVGTGGMVVNALYDTGEPMSYARVEVSAPGAKLAFQSGRTDRNGRFCFFPDVPGDWKVVVDDEIGHRLKVNVPVDEAMRTKKDSTAGRSEIFPARYEKALIGVGFIFCISGIFFWWKGKRILRKVNEKRHSFTHIEK